MIDQFLKFELLPLLLPTMIVGFFLCLFVAVFCFENPKEKFFTKPVIFVFVLSWTILHIFGLSIVIKDDQEKIAIINAEKAWVAAKCPLYQGQCGGKSKYACELKGTVVGRNRVGEVFVMAYPTC